MYTEERPRHPEKPKRAAFKQLRSLWHYFFVKKIVAQISNLNNTSTKNGHSMFPDIHTSQLYSLTIKENNRAILIIFTLAAFLQTSPHQMHRPLVTNLYSWSLPYKTFLFVPKWCRQRHLTPHSTVQMRWDTIPSYPFSRLMGLNLKWLWHSRDWVGAERLGAGCKGSVWKVRSVPLVFDG